MNDELCGFVDDWSDLIETVQNKALHGKYDAKVIEEDKEKKILYHNMHCVCDTKELSYLCIWPMGMLRIWCFSNYYKGLFNQIFTI